MEAHELHEIEEQGENARDNMRYVSFTMSVLAVLVAITTVLGHRAHTHSVLNQARASDQWNLYQAKKIRQYDTQLTVDLLAAMPVRDAAAAAKIADGYKSHLAKWDDDLNQEYAKATQLEDEVRRAERRAARYDLGEALFEIALVITSITLLTRQRAYWYLGLAFGAAGIIVVGLAFVITFLPH